MTNPKHTPGPWTIDETGLHLQIRGNLSDRKHMAHEEVVARVFHLDDAHLISAATDMLEALKYAREFILRNGGEGKTHKIDNAIAKATGGAYD